MNASRSGPIVGLTTYLDRAQTGVWDVSASFLPAQYVQGVTMAGGIAVLLPPQQVSPDAAGRVLDRLDGLVITGARTSTLPVMASSRIRKPTGRASSATPGSSRCCGGVATGLPVLGICRGAQLLNVACGGTLHQHLPDVLGHDGHRAGNAVFSSLPVRTVPGTRLAALIGESAEVRCYHHQAIADVGDPWWSARGTATALPRRWSCPGRTS